MSSVSIQQRDERIAAAVAAGDSHAQVAAREGIAQKTVQRALRRRRARTSRSRTTMALAAPEPVVIDPCREVCQALAELHQVGHEARRLASEARQESVQVAALKIITATAMERIDLLDRFGALPTGPAWMSELRAEAGWKAMREVAGAAGLDVDALRTITQQRIAERVRHDESAGLLRLAVLAPFPREQVAA